MKNRLINLTRFRVEKLVCQGMHKPVSPYQITPVPGQVLGQIGQVMVPVQQPEQIMDRIRVRHFMSA